MVMHVSSIWMCLYFHEKIRQFFLPKCTLSYLFEFRASSTSSVTSRRQIFSPKQSVQTLCLKFECLVFLFEECTEDLSTYVMTGSRPLIKKEVEILSENLLHPPLFPPPSPSPQQWLLRKKIILVCMGSCRKCSHILILKHIFHQGRCTHHRITHGKLYQLYCLCWEV